MNAVTKRSPGFAYSPMFNFGEDDTKYRKLDIAGISTIEVEGKTVLKVRAEALSALAFAAFRDVSHLLRPAHLAQLAKILQDPEASENDRYVALEFLKNANIAAAGIVPGYRHGAGLRQEGPAGLGRGR
jgi:fumarate hydratase class I